VKKIGVFICRCGINIASTVDVEKLKAIFEKYDKVAFVEEYKYMCSDPGQALVKDMIKKHQLDGIVVAACSPTLHEATFRKAAQSAGLNPYQCEIANIREQCSWVHKDKEVATHKAEIIIKSMIEKVLLNESLNPISVPVTKKALVIGGGIAGIQAALNIANSGYKVILVERSPSIGGRMAQLSETFPTLDCSQCILTPKMVEVSGNENIELMCYSEVVDVSGFVGNFEVKIAKKARYVDWDKCNGCGLCIEKCPKKVESEFDRYLGKRKAIYKSFPQAVPNRVVIDRENCIYLNTGKCGICEKVCPVSAIDYKQEQTIITEKVGAIVVATGYELYSLESLPEYGGGELPDVIDGLTFERLLSASGPTGGVVKRPSDGKVPRDVVFVQCAGSRDPANHNPYCSRICCMYTAKHAMLYKHRVHDGNAYIFYMDIRSGGKNYEEFVQRVMEEEKVVYLRGKVSKIYKDKDKLIVRGVDTLSMKTIELSADMVVLATAIRPVDEIETLAKLLKIQVDKNGFLTEAHPKLRPVEALSPGIYLAGCAQAPRDIPDTVAQASGAASMVTALFKGDELYHEPIIAGVDEDLCSGCAICISVCPYDARKLNAEKKIVEVNEVLCEGCGACSSACPSHAAQQKNFTDAQLKNMVKAILTQEGTENV